MEKREYQEKAADWLASASTGVRRERGCVVAPAGCGKTYIAALALLNATKGAQRRLRVGWLANTKEQCEQARDAIAAFPELDGKLLVKIACAAAATDWSDRDVLIVDESHHAGSADGWFNQSFSCRGTLWGFTATPPDDPEALSVWKELFKEVFTVSREAVQHKLAPARVILLDDTDSAADLRVAIDADIASEVRRRRRWWKGGDQELWGQVAWQACVTRGIVHNRSRTLAAATLAVNEHAKDSVLILVNQIAHGEELQKCIPGSALCFSKMGAKARRETIARFRSGDLKCMIATSLADEGADFPRANVLILVSAGRSEARTIQRTGRVLRQYEGKTEAKIYDFADVWHPLAAKHSRRRQEIYQTLGYKL